MHLADDDGLGKKGLAMGWTTWLDQYLMAKHQMRMLQASAARIARPRLSAAYTHWLHDWDADRAALASMTQAEREAKEKAER